MFIEFIGLPASGKTTLALNYLNNAYSGEHICFPSYEIYELNWIKRNFSKLTVCLKYFFKNKSNCVQLAKIILKTKQNYLLDNFRLFLNGTYLMYLQEQYSHWKGIIIFDEGISHLIWAVSLRASKDVDIESILTLFYKPELIFYVYCPLVEVSKRIKGRQKNNKRHQLVLESINYQEKQIREIVNYLKNIKDRLHTDIVELLNTDTADINRNRQAIIESIYIRSFLYTLKSRGD